MILLLIFSASSLAQKLENYNLNNRSALGDDVPDDWRINDDDWKNIPENQPQKHFIDDIPNTEKDANGKLKCIDGYISDGEIDSRGCWVCSLGCSTNQICKYPGTCTYPIPIIESAVSQYFSKNKDGSKSIIVKYHTYKSSYNPSYAFCQIDGMVSDAIKVDNSAVYCKPSIDSPKLIAVSFDKELWSEDHIIISHSSISNLYTAPAILCISCIILAIIVVILICFYIKRKKNMKKLPVLKEARCLAYFPKIDDSDEGLLETKSVMY